MQKFNYSLACLLFSISPALIAQTNLGAVDIGSATISSITATIIHPGTLAAISVTTGGKPNLDFTSTGGNCQVGTAYAASATCTIAVTFAPTLAGQRFGGFVLMNQDGSIAAQGYLRGTGSGPQITYLPGTRTQLLNNIPVPNGLAAASNGSIYAVEGYAQLVGQIGQIGTGEVVQFPGGTNSASVDSVGDLGYVSVDGAGNTYLPGLTFSESALQPNGNYTGLFMPYNIIGADAAGNLFAPCNAGLCKETLQPDDTYLESTVTTDSNLDVYYIDGNGDVFAGENDGMLHEFISTPSGYTPIAGTAGAHIIAALSADGLGNIYGLDSAGNVYKETPQQDGSVIQTYLFNSALAVYVTNTQLIQPAAAGNRLAADPAGNLYFWAATGTDPSVSSLPPLQGQTYPVYGLFEENYSLPSTLTFPATAQGAASGSQTVTITNSGNLPLQFSAIEFPADFTETSHAASECREGISLIPNASCTLTIGFKPTAAPINGTATPLTEQVLVTTNLHNAPGTQQAITGTGTVTAAP